MKTITATGFTWLVVDLKEQADMDFLQDELKLNLEVLTYAKDKNELARLEYDKFSEELLIIYHAICLECSQTYQTSPVFYYLSGNQLITIFSEKTYYLLPMFEKILAKQQDLSILEFVFTTMFLISKAYFPVLEELHKKRDDLSRKLRFKTSKQSLLALSDLGTSLIYLVSATKQNTLLFEQMRSQAFYKNLSESELEQLEDAQIEARQLMEMTNLSSQVVDQLEGTYNNILNNNLNDTMEYLTKLSILLVIPAIVTGFFGMNVELPKFFIEGKEAWLWIIGLSGVLCLTSGAILRIFMKMGKKQR
jgi:corA family magnesium transporter